MSVEILNTLYYLLLVFIGLPTIYFLSASGGFNKKLALRIYPISLFLILLVTVLIYGVDNTKKVIGQAFGDFIFFLFNAALGFGLVILVALLFLGNWGDIIYKIKKKLKKK